ncbi:hypothetical protein [Kibdelosporangium phytohabitans]|uniref:Uncharacterized protein n=1 Tax=Kibdelosporangium phytohabitans TaxID=860235 RepID=A0A0N9HZA3_9PSEU|nr:hypothetical protein [Kibdelosporangium phytohabitans]ALG08769.1 hypothetical protein AOZ06_19260 [Kibdelosporangium phytohabitans]MBE1470107.1 hypothetical protein [Kibdelosporangium phytohabitans]
MDDHFFGLKVKDLTESVIRTGWLSEEGLVDVRPCAGHFLAVVGGEQHVPHAPAEDAQLPKCRMKAPKWPLPSDLVTGGKFLHDEWVYDPSINGRVLTDTPDRDAVHCANHLIAGNGRAFLVLTTRRVAVVIEQQDVDGDSAMTRFAGLLSKDKQKKEDAQRLVTWWEADRSRVRAVNEITHGRHLSNLRRFTALVFADGSVLETRAP